jgi:RecA-family ATPase
MMALKSLTASEFLSLEVPPRDFIVEPFLPEKSLIEIYARTGVGKTTFALALAVAAASGQSFFNWHVSRTWKVLYIDGEMSAREMQDRTHAASKYFKQDPKTIFDLRFISRDLETKGLPDIGDPDGQAWFESDLQWADLIFLDNMSCLWWSGRENDADAWSVIQKWLSKLKEAGKSVVMLHHSGKNGSSRGSSRRHDALDTVVKLERPYDHLQKDGAKFEVHFEKSRGFAGNAAQPVGLVHTLSDGVSDWQTFHVGLEKAIEVAELSKQGMRQIDIAAKLGISQPEVSRRRAEAVSAGLL